MESKPVSCHGIWLSVGLYIGGWGHEALEELGWTFDFTTNQLQNFRKLNSCLPIPSVSTISKLHAISSIKRFLIPTAKLSPVKSHVSVNPTALVSFSLCYTYLCMSLHTYDSPKNELLGKKIYLFTSLCSLKDLAVSSESSQWLSALEVICLLTLNVDSRDLLFSAVLSSAVPTNHMDLLRTWYICFVLLVIFYSCEMLTRFQRQYKICKISH